MKVRQKQIEFEAIRFDESMRDDVVRREEQGYHKHPFSIMCLLGGEGVGPPMFFVRDVAKTRIVVGDWIIEDGKGRHFACKPDVFNERYERVEGDTTTQSGGTDAVAP